MGGAFHGALTIPIGFALNPRKYVSNLAQTVESAGATIYGDTPAPRLHLHACSLAFTHPSDGRWMAFESPVPFVLP